MNKRMTYVLMMFLGITLGCMSSQKGYPTHSSTSSAHYPSNMASEIKNNINLLKSMLEENTLSDDYRRIVSGLLSVYRQLENELASTFTVSNATLVQELYENLTVLQNALFKQGGEQISENSRAIRIYSEKRDQILDAYMSNNYQAVVDKCIQLKAAFGPDALTQDVGILFAFALGEMDMREEAIDIGERLAFRLESTPDLIQLRIRIAEWYLNEQDKTRAASIYEKIADTLDDKGIDLQFLRRKIELADKKDKSLHSTSHPRSGAKTFSVEQVILEAEKLLEENRFNEARELLFSRRSKELSFSEKKAIQMALKKLEAGEAGYLEKKIAMISMKQDMEQAQKLLEDEKYEQVIDRLKTMEAEAPNREITDLKNFTIEKLINRERNKAAELFLSARKAVDQTEKAVLLTKSLGILNDLVSKYPESALTPKIRSHIRIVDQELKKVK